MDLLLGAVLRLLIVGVPVAATCSANAKTVWDEEGGFVVMLREIRATRAIGAITIAVIALVAAGLTRVVA